MDNDIANKVDRVWKELNAMKSKQSMSHKDLSIPAVVGNYSGSDTRPSPQITEMTFILRVTYKPLISLNVSYPPLAQCAYREYERYIHHPDIPMESFWSEPIIESISGNSISWLIHSGYFCDYEWIEAGTIGRNIQLDIQIFSPVQGTITTTRVL